MKNQDLLLIQIMSPFPMQKMMDRTTSRKT